MIRSLFMTAAAGGLTLAGAAAHAEVTLTYEWTDISCGVTAADGSRSTAPCATTSFSALIQPGESVYVNAHLSYAYHDDGLALAQPVILQPSPFNTIVLNHEAAVLPVTYSVCRDYASCNAQAYDHIDSAIGPPPLYPLVLGNNPEPDELSGTTFVFASSGLPTSYPGFVQRSVFFDVLNVQTYSGIAAAVPEPASYALILAGLAVVVTAARRRRRG
jgi:PEP-CTERM motif